MTSKKVAIKDTAILATGSISAQIITLLLMPVVTRLYAPDQFGLLGTILALSIPIVAISSLRYFDAIMLPDEEGEALEICVDPPRGASEHLRLADAVRLRIRHGVGV